MRLITFGPPSAEHFDRLLAELATASVTYDHVGSTLDRAAPGRRHTVELGTGTGTFDLAVAGLRAWACHQGIGATIHPVGAALAEGTDVIVVLHLGPIRLLVPDRIVAVVDEPDRFGFAYGTLPGHAERGEESFIVERAVDGCVTATIRVHARGSWLVARLAGPVVGLLQRIASRRYLGALRGFVETHEATP